jgi:hypothetical protein
MPKAERSTRRGRSRATGSRALARDGVTRSGIRDSTQLVARILETPHLARAVPRLPPVVLHRLIQSHGLEDCGELIALTTPEQLSAVFDLDLWRSVRPGTEEAFDAARFVVWLEVLVESGTAFAARRLAEIDMALVTAALTPYVAVYDPAVVDGDVVVAAALKDRPQCEVGGYVIAAKHTDAWEAIVGVLIALAQDHPDVFHRVMGECRRLSNSKPEPDGFHDLLDEPEQASFDLALDREGRRERLGYVSAEQARAFLETARQANLERDLTASPNPILTAYFRAVDIADVHAEHGAAAESTDAHPSEEVASAVAAVVDVLRDAGVLPDQPRLLLGPAEGQPRLARIQQHMQLLREHDPAIHSVRSQELAFLANVLVSGCPIQSRSFTMREAFDGAVAICNFGLENWPADKLPEDFLATHDLAAVFQVGWTVLYRNVCLSVTEQLVSILGSLECRDREIQLGLFKLRREMTRHLEAGAPWHARDALDVIAMLDMPVWAALLALIAECPVMLANVSASAHSRPHSVDPAVFEFISENSHIMAVRAFVQTLPNALSGS